MNACEEASTKSVGFEECNVCGEQHDTSQCPLLPIVQKVKDECIPSRARLTLPYNLTLTEINGHIGVVAKEKIPLGTQFGPLDAPKVAHFNCQPRFPLKLFLKDSRYIYLNTTDESKCNWMCLVTPSKDENDQNLIAYQLHQDIFFSSQKEINVGDELIVGYAFAYGRKMATSKASVDDQNVSEIGDNNLNATPIKRKRGRRPKSSKSAKLTDLTQKQMQGSNSADETPLVDESLIRSLGARELGIVEGQQEWKCSQCHSVFLDCLEFAKHLQGHYKPTSYNRGRGRGRGRRKMRKKHIERPHALDEELEKEVGNTDPPEITVEQESSPSAVEQESFLSQQGDSGIDGDMDKDTSELQAPNDDSSSETISIPGTVNCATQTYSSRGRKRKSEMVDKEKDDDDKKYEFVSREISQSVSGKYNLRTTRKALVIPKEEIDDCDETVYDENYDDTDYDDDNSIAQYENLQEESFIETSVTVPSTISNTLEPLSIAAREILSALVEQAQEDTNEQASSKMGTQNTIETSDIIQSNEKKTVHTSFLQAKYYHSKRPGRYKCDLCGKGFSKTLYLFRHIRKHTGEFTCEKCHRVFARKENMLKHKCPGLTDMQDGKEFDYHCSYCNKAFTTEKILECHMAKHTGEFTCEDCGKSYCTKDSLMKHSCPVKPSTEQYICGICRKCFTKEIYLLKHLPVHTGQHACQICGKWLRSYDSLTNHMRMCSQVKEIEDNGEAKCPNCHKIFTDVSEYRRHQYEHTHIHMCDTCGARFRNLMSLRLHVCQGKVMNCEICGKIFTSASNLQRHKLAHGDPEYKCEKCGKAFYRKDTLLKHSCKEEKQDLTQNKKKKSVNLMPLICEKCGSMFSSMSSLNVHRNLHGEKKFSCEYCGKKFHRKDLLLEHHAVHGDPRYPCSACQKLFKTKKSLDIHMMIHDGIKRFKCKTCGKAFFQKGNVQKHEETHETDRKYLCTICQKSFSRKQYFNMHLLEHTRGRIYSCGVCGRSFVKEHQLRSHHRMFHSNRVYKCSYCDLTLKLRHSLKRHLRKKHANYENEWRQAEFINSMLTTKEQIQQNMDKESYLMSDVTSAQGAEVLLAVAGLGNQELSEAIASGRAHIKRGSAPNTFEISVPFSFDQCNEENANQQIILATEETNNVQNSATDKPLHCPLQLMYSNGKDYHIALPVEAGEIQTSEGGEYQIALPVHEHIASENQQNEVTLPSQALPSAEQEYEIPIQHNNSNEDHLEVNVVEDHTNATETEHYQILSEISNHVEAQYEEIQPGEITLQKQYPNKSPKQENINETEYQVAIPEPREGTNETEEYQITLSDEQTSADLVAQTEDGQQIVISGQSIPIGTHHIVLDTANIQQLTEENVMHSQDTIVLEEGTILQQSGDNVLLYVLTNDQSQ